MLSRDMRLPSSAVQINAFPLVPEVERTVNSCAFAGGLASWSTGTWASAVADTDRNDAAAISTTAGSGTRERRDTDFAETGEIAAGRSIEHQVVLLRLDGRRRNLRLRIRALMGGLAAWNSKARNHNNGREARGMITFGRCGKYYQVCSERARGDGDAAFVRTNASQRSAAGERK